jgi:hypothetical protein
MLKLCVLLIAVTFAVDAYAIGVTIATTVIGLAAGTFAATAVAFAINLVVSAVISKVFFSPNQPSNGAASESPNPGNRQTLQAATDNKLPVVYGSAYVGGTIVDLSITQNNQIMYYVVAISEVTNTNTGQTPDSFTFGDIYYAGKKVIFKTNGHEVDGLLDESTGIVDNSISGYIVIYLYNNGTFSQTNSPFNAFEVMNSGGLVYVWDNSKLMTNCAFAIVRLVYNAEANIRGLEQLKFQINNPRSAPGDCIRDYLINERYGAALPEEQINNTSLANLNSYSSGSFSYIDADGNPATQPRFTFNGTINTARTIMDNLQEMSTCCDSLVKYNEVTGQWGVIVQRPTYTVAMNLTDSNMISAITITPMDIAATYNVVECKFPDNSNQDSFNSSTFDLAEIAPSLLFPNEPVNKVSLSLPFVNNDVQAQYIANRILKTAREDLQVQVDISFVGIQLDAGDIVTVTSINYGWVEKLFRVTKVVQTFMDDGAIVVKLNLSEFTPSVYDDVSITQFQPSPNTGIGDPTFFGTIAAPVVLNQYPTNTNPLFLLQVTTATSGITQYAEVWYSAYSSPTPEQLYFAGTSEIQSNGLPWGTNAVLPSISLANIPFGNWYFFSRMVNSLASSQYSPPSAIFRWRPSTFQYSDRYLLVAYANDINGAGFSLNPRNKLYYGLLNQDSTTPNTTASDYTWYFAEPSFGTNIYLAYSNRSGRKFSFDTGFATYAAGTGSFVPSQALLFDPSIWAALPDGTNYIDLDLRTGQLIQTGTTSVGTGEIAITNNSDGKVVASLKQYLDFGGAYQYTSSVANLTVDIYGRVVGFEAPDNFYYTDVDFTATAGQTAFTVTRNASYITDQCFVMQNGVLLDESEYTDSLTTVTLAVGATAGDIISITSFRSTGLSGTYASFTRNTANLVAASAYTASGFTLTSGYELMFLNGTILNEQDYDITDQTISNFPSLVTGKLTIIQWTPNNLGTPNGNPVNVVNNTVVGQTTYSFAYDANAFNLYENGIMLKQGTDFTTAVGQYTLAIAPTTINNIMVNQTFARTGAA